jgi:hypothetical protein
MYSILKNKELSISSNEFVSNEYIFDQTYFGVKVNNSL